ncbi:MAG: methionyl-tRNA formyltransferase [Clostridia bacterium]|nr:methionyl-tRNA formyltransferase [Clostridia bacterium]NCC42243.1 methionyl-tRNA formyltransferase [Clostridia bacterium]
MRVVFMGTPDFSVGTLKALVKEGHQIVGVVSQPDKPKGRGKNLQPTPVKEAALEMGLTVYQPKKVRDPEFFKLLESLKPEVIVVVAFGQIIPESILNLAPYGCINVHASLLPKYRGAAPIQWAVIDGEEKSGVTIMKMDAGLDTGDMISKVEVRIEEDETGGTLFDKLSEAGAKLLVETLPSLAAQTAVYEKQPEESPTAYAGMIQKSMGDMDWNRPAIELERLVRGLNPWPSAYTKLNGKTLKIWKASVITKEKTEEINETDLCAGTILRADEKGIWIQTKDGILNILELQLEGKKRMETQAFLRGYSVETGRVLPF